MKSRQKRYKTLKEFRAVKSKNVMKRAKRSDFHIKHSAELMKRKVELMVAFRLIKILARIHTRQCMKDKETA